jgi:hypothetical protein
MSHLAHGRPPTRGFPEPRQIFAQIPGFDASVIAPLERGIADLDRIAQAPEAQFILLLTQLKQAQTFTHHFARMLVLTRMNIGLDETVTLVAKSFSGGHAAF